MTQEPVFGKAAAQIFTPEANAIVQAPRRGVKRKSLLHGERKKKQVLESISVSHQ